MTPPATKPRTLVEMAELLEIPLIGGDDDPNYPRALAEARLLRAADAVVRAATGAYEYLDGDDRDPVVIHRLLGEALAAYERIAEGGE